ncbi:hypothetical protein H5203_18875 [Pseudoalteromonas sp. SG41-1]|uniref:hypothetical protein n=1 Tax=Pseudoalteromonas sp. SG41-1 TaxID=2760979 RepID=UPI0015FFA69B|nr:hypothetical protein [Pseudoalteromonas sp. SG41-1]MBB1507533.1 hypothetical protein [Pseudoalteromonas sp. SG41-1]
MTVKEKLSTRYAVISTLLDKQKPVKKSDLKLFSYLLENKNYAHMTGRMFEIKQKDLACVLYEKQPNISASIKRLCEAGFLIRVDKNKFRIAK